MNSEGVSIRQAGVADAECVGRLFAGAGLCGGEDGVRRVSVLLGSSLARCFVAEFDGQAVGAVAVSFNGFQLFLSHMAVTENWRRRGLGQRLHEKVVEYGQEVGAKSIITDAWLMSAPFFQRLGYRMPAAVFLIRDMEEKAE